MSGSSEEPFEIVLIDADGDALDTKTVFVESAATEINNQFQNQSKTDDEYVSEPDTMKECTKCESLLDVKCMIFNYKCGL